MDLFVAKVREWNEIDIDEFKEEIRQGNISCETMVKVDEEIMTASRAVEICHLDGICWPEPKSDLRDGFKYALNSEGTAFEVVKYRGTAANVVILDYIDDVPVTSIGEYAFRGVDSLCQVEIPNTVTTIEPSAFENCSNLTHINIPEGVSVLNERTFSGCLALKQLKLPSSLKEIKALAFKNCGSLEKMDIPESVTIIENGIFQDCHSLREVKFPPKVTAPLRYPFMRCYALEQVILPNTMSEIESVMFYECHQLRKINIPDNISKIERDAFWECESLSEFEMSDNHPYFTKKDNVLFSKDEKTLIVYPAGKKESEYKIPEGVKSIEDTAFSGAKSLKKIEIPESVTSFGSDVFMDCPNLTLYGQPNSPAEDYAAANRIKFVGKRL